ncbi:MAG: DNA polymerase III subunit alpha [bacterium]
MDFVHLHVHSHYSLLDGAVHIEDLVQTAVNFGMKSVALTDHGNLFGAYEFHDLALKAGITPIFGIEAYISPTHRTDRSMGRIETAAYHILLLAINDEGWRNLMKLSSRAFTEGFYYRPRIDRELLAQFGKGLVCCSACLGGEIPSAILADDEEKAKRIAGEYVDLFGQDRFFIEIQNQGYADQVRVNPALVRVAKHVGVGLVGTNDTHFLSREDKSAHEILTCIGTGKVLTEETKQRYSPDLYFKNQAEMIAALAEWPEAISNTCRIAEMNEAKPAFYEKQLPVFHTPDGEPDSGYLARLARQGLKERFGGKEPPTDYRERLDRELQVIDQKGYSSYFLIINDCVQYARKNNIPAGPRGSGVATLLGYALHLSHVDPIKYGLIFERFTDPQRKEDPDIDLDFCQDGREQVIQYVRKQYGNVAQIITFGTLKARAAIRDVGRVMDVPLVEVDKIAKMIPEGPKSDIVASLKGQADLNEIYESDPRAQQLIDLSIKLENTVRHSGVHAAGIVICDRPLDDFVPLFKQTDSPDVITQWDGETCGKVGLMKMDFLGLRTLSIIQRARDLVRQRTGVDLDPDSLPLDDQEVFEIFRRGDTDGIFQFDGEGMQGSVVQVKPNRIEDLIAINAMYRPGPIKHIATYCNRKSGKEPVPSIHPLVDDLLAETFGIMIYQEQVMQVTNRLGKLPLHKALTLIKAISKKQESVLASAREEFLKGAGENGIEAAEATRIFDLILEFAKYGFNKAHSARYAILAFQQAHFKVHYPREFIAATLTFEREDRDKFVRCLADAPKMGTIVASPDVNTCTSDFVVDGEQVRFGLSAVKGVGEKAVEAIAQARRDVGKFKDLCHFCRTVDLRAVNRSTIEALIKCGAFDSISAGAHRAAMVAGLEKAIQAGQKHASDRRCGQSVLFEQGGDTGEETAHLPDVPPWSREEMLVFEKETLGFYVSSHPLEHIRSISEGLNWPRKFTIELLAKQSDYAPVACCCVMTQVRSTVTKKGKSAGKKMAMLVLEDLSSKCEAVVFAETFEKYSALVRADAMVYVT